MNRDTHEPDKSVGGTFHYDADGRFLHHTAPTRPASAPAQSPDATSTPIESAPADAPVAAPAATPHRKRGFLRGNQE